MRQQLKAVGAPADLIETVYGIGYRLKLFQAIITAISAPPIEPEKLEPGKQSQQQTLTAIAGVWERFKDRVSEQVIIIFASPNRAHLTVGGVET